MNGGCAAGSSSAAAEATTKRPELDVTEEARKKSHVDATGSSRKWPYEYSEREMDVTMEKLYKCNYWEDPAHAARVRYYGLKLARAAALDNFIERLHREFEAYMAGQPFKP